jgi:flagellar M-ring protein FliF
MDQVALVLDNLKSLGGKKLAALALMFGLIVTVVLAGGLIICRARTRRRFTLASNETM